MTDHEYPEHEKLARISDQSQRLGEFLEWAEEKGWHLAEWQDEIDYMLPIHLKKDQVLARYFGIDLDRLHAEKDAMYQALSEAARE
jgi:hypothetical protein